MSNKIINTVRDLLLIERDLAYRFDYEKDNPSYDDFEICMFEQVWPSTALGFGGIGGQAITTAMTYVFIPVSCKQDCFIYFGSDFAYHVPYGDKLLEDVKSHRMESVMRSGKYRR